MGTYRDQFGQATFEPTVDGRAGRQVGRSDRLGEQLVGHGVLPAAEVRIAGVTDARGPRPQQPPQGIVGVQPGRFFASSIASSARRSAQSRSSRQDAEL